MQEWFPLLNKHIPKPAKNYPGADCYTDHDIKIQPHCP